MPVDLGTLTRVDPGQVGAVGGRDRSADRTVALLYAGAVTQTACWEERSQVCNEIRLTLAEVRRRTPSAEPAWGPRGTTPRLTVRGTTAGAPPPPPPPLLHHPITPPYYPPYYTTLLHHPITPPYYTTLLHYPITPCLALSQVLLRSGGPQRPHGQRHDSFRNICGAPGGAHSGKV